MNFRSLSSSLIGLFLLSASSLFAQRITVSPIYPGGGSIVTTNTPNANDVLYSDGSIYYWGPVVATSTNALPAYVLTNNNVGAAAFLSKLYVSDRVQAPNILWTNIYYVNATNSDPIINGTILTNTSTKMPLNCLVVVGPGNYYIPTNVVSLLPAIGHMYCMPGARISSGNLTDGDPRIFFDDALLAAPITNNIFGYGEFYMTNNNGLGAVLYEQDANSKVKFQAKSASMAGDGFAIWVEAGELDYDTTDFTRSDAVNAFACGGLSAKVRVKSDKVYSKGPLIAAYSVANIGDSVWNINYAEAISGVSTESRTITLGTNVIMSLGVVNFKRTNNTITTQYPTNEVNAGGIPGLIKDTTFYALPAATSGIISPVLGSSGWFGANLTLKDCVIYGPSGVDPILAETSVGGLLRLENCTIYEGASATNWIRGFAGQARVHATGLKLNRNLVANANVTTYTNYTLSSMEIGGGLGISGTTRSGFFYPSNITASRLIINGADGIPTNAPAGSAGQYLKQDLTWDTPTGAGDPLSLGTLLVGQVSNYVATVVDSGSGTWNLFGSNSWWYGNVSSNVSIDFSIPIARSNTVYSLFLTNNASTITWPAAWRWIDGATYTDAPTLQTGSYIVNVLKSLQGTNAWVNTGRKFSLIPGQNIAFGTNITSGLVTNSLANLVTNLSNVKFAVLRNSTLTFSNLVWSLNTNTYELIGQTNVVLTNIVGMLDLENVSTKIYLRPSGVNMTLAYPAFTAPTNGYYWRTNVNSPMWTTATNGKTYVISMEAIGTNLFSTITEWP